VQVRHGEGVASYTGPESCACGREAASEALIGEHVGQVLSGEHVVRMNFELACQVCTRPSEDNSTL
jgi:hypothetical protein